MHIKFLIFTWQPKGGGGGLNPLNPPPPVDPPLPRITTWSSVAEYKGSHVHL